LTALAIFLQALILFAIFLSVRKLARTLQQDSEELRASAQELRSAALPMIDNAREVFSRVAPKVELIAGDLSEVIYGMRVQSADMQSSAKELLEQVRIQSLRVDAMLTQALDAADRAGVYVAHAVVKPVRQISAVVASVRAVVEALRSSSPAHRRAGTGGDRERLG